MLASGYVRVLIMGNSGSGKSTYGRQLASEHALPLLELDLIVWEPHRIAVERPAERVRADLATFLDANREWIIEGCDGDLIERALPACTELVFLNPGLAVCLENNRRRPWEPHKYDSAADQERLLPYLLGWVEGYYARTDARSLACHRGLFDAHRGNKREVR